MNVNSIYNKLRAALTEQIRYHQLENQPVQIRCKKLSPMEAIGNPDHEDYPISKGREFMIEAVFQNARGQAFTDDFTDADYRIQDLVQLDLNHPANRAGFIAALNSIYLRLGLCDKTVHCRDAEMVRCAENLCNEISENTKVLLIGHQPRFLEVLSSHCQIRAIDLDEDNIGKNFFGVTIEPRQNTADAIKWCDLIFATGSTIVNGTITGFLNQEKPVLFYGVTISAAARILGLQTYCHCGN